MRLATKQRLDWHLGLPILVLLDWLATLWSLAVHRRERLGPVGRILIIKFQGMGSLAIARPAIRELRRHHPEARIVFWGVRGTCALAEQMPEVDEVITLRDTSLPAAALSLASCLLKVWRGRFDWVFDLEVYSKLSTVLTTLTLIRNRAGFAVFLVRQRRHLYSQLVVFNTYDYLGVAYRRLFGLILPRAAAPELEIPLTWRFAAEPLPDLPPSYIVLSPHAGDLCLERKWPLDSWFELTRGLSRVAPGTALVLLGWGEEECAENRRWPAELGVVDLGGKLPVPELVRCLAHARLVVTVDSAPLHLALLTATPVVALFGPTRPRTYFPPGTGTAVSLSLELYCSPCLHHWDRPPCNGNNQCMRALSVEEVLHWARRQLGKGAADGAFRRPRLVDPEYYEGRIYPR